MLYWLSWFSLHKVGRMCLNAAILCRCGASHQKGHLCPQIIPHDADVAIRLRYSVVRSLLLSLLPPARQIFCLCWLPISADCRTQMAQCTLSIFLQHLFVNIQDAKWQCFSGSYQWVLLVVLRCAIKTFSFCIGSWSQIDQ